MGTQALNGYLTVREVSRRLKVSEGRVRQLLVELKDENGALPGVLVGSTRLLDEAAVCAVEALHASKRPYTYSK